MSIIQRFLNVLLIPLFGKFGYKLYPKTNLEINNTNYETIIPKATYAPWQKNPSFEKTFSKINMYFRVDKFQCFELWQLIEQSKKLETGNIIEFSEYNVTASIVAAQQIGILNSNTAGLIIATIINDTVPDNTRRNIEVHVGTISEIDRKISQKISYRLCYINIDLNASSTNILKWSWDRLVSNGMMIINNYGLKKNARILEEMETFQSINKNNCLRIYNLNGQAVLLKIRN